MHDFIPLSVPHITGNAEAYLCECVRSGYVSTVGPLIDRFEQALSDYTETQFAIATMNGTSALHLALLCCGLSTNEEVLAPAFSFVASVNAIRYVGAYPVLVDVDRSHWTIDPELVERFLQDECQPVGGNVVNKSTGRRVAGVLAVHLYGHPADVDRLKGICKRFNLFFVEDAAESIGAMYRTKKLGCWGDASILSFNGNKTITSGAGGAVLTNDENVARRAKHLSTQAKQDPLAYVHDEIGFNYRMSNLQAALGLSQLEVVDSFLERKRHIARRYRLELADLQRGGLVEFQAEAPWATSSNWLNAVVIGEELSNSSEDAVWRSVVASLQEAGIQSRPFWHPLHMLAPHADLQTVGGKVTESVCRRGVCLPSSVSLTEAEQDRVVEVFRSVVERLT